MKLPEPAILEKVWKWLDYGDDDSPIARHGFSMPEPPGNCRASARRCKAISRRRGIRDFQVGQEGQSLVGDPDQVLVRNCHRFCDGLELETRTANKPHTGLGCLAPWSRWTGRSAG